METALKQTKTYLMSSNGVKVEMYNDYELYQKLSKMDEFSRLSAIKMMNKIYGYDAINYKALELTYKDKDINDTLANNNTTNSDFERDYVKAYMKLMSV